jgi:hypothetical protein
LLKLLHYRVAASRVAVVTGRPLSFPSASRSCRTVEVAVAVSTEGQLTAIAAGCLATQTKGGHVLQMPAARRPKRPDDRRNGWNACATGVVGQRNVNEPAGHSGSLRRPEKHDACRPTTTPQPRPSSDLSSLSLLGARRRDRSFLGRGGRDHMK